MAVQFKPLPANLFDPKVRPYIERLNRDLRDIFGMEGVLRNPIVTRRSDQSIVRRSDVQVDVSRITPPLSDVVSGASTVVGAPALVFGTSNIVGTTTTAIAVDSTIAIFGAQVPSNIAASAAVGTSAFAARADHVHRWPSAIATEASASDSITLTDDGTSGALLTSSASFAQNILSLLAPNATNPLSIGKYGNLAQAGNTPTDQVMLTFSKTDFNETAANVAALNATLTNTNRGGGGVIIRGINLAVSGSCADVGSSATSNTVEGCRVTLTGGATGNSQFQGSLFGFRSASNIISSSTIGTSVGSLVEFQSSNSTLVTRSFLGERVSFEAQGTVTLLTSATLNSQTGFRCNALTAGTSRIGYECRGFAAGTLAIGFRSFLHSGGTTRRSFYGENTAEFGRDILVGSTGGVVFKDAQGTPRWWRQTITATGNTGGSISIDENGFVSGIRTALATGSITVNINDTGTTIQAT